MVTIDLVATRDGKEFDRRTDLTFVLGEGEDLDIPKGLELGIEKMKKEEEGQITLSPKNGFGQKGCEKLGIPGSDIYPLVYEINLKTFERAKESWQMDGDQKLVEAKIYREKGTEFFKAAKIDIAANKYRKIIDLLEHEISLKGDEETERRSLLQAGRLNLTACYLKQQEWIEARDLCDKIIEENKAVPKAYFRRGEAMIQLNDHEMAREDFKRCLEFDPGNKAAQNKITFCTNQIKLQKSKEKETFANMFTRFAEQDARKEAERRKREKPLVINEWEDKHNKANAQETLEVSGDLKMNIDLNKEMSNGDVAED